MPLAIRMVALWGLLPLYLGLGAVVAALALAPQVALKVRLICGALTLILAGSHVPLPDAIDALDELSVSSRLRQQLRQVLAAIRKGSTLYAALLEQGCLGHKILEKIHDGETSGQLPEVLRSLFV
ncbi:type II secretion system F family protein [bacterium]|nr:type II secretion system F family protein [bacterium]